MSSEESFSVDITNSVQDARSVWEIGLISAAVAVLSLIIVILVVWLCVKKCKKKAEEDRKPHEFEDVSNGMAKIKLL